MAHKPAISADIIRDLASKSGVASGEYKMPENKYDALRFVDKLHAAEATEIQANAVAAAGGKVTDKSIG